MAVFVLQVFDLCLGTEHVFSMNSVAGVTHHKGCGIKRSCSICDQSFWFNMWNGTVDEIRPVNDMK